MRTSSSTRRSSTTLTHELHRLGSSVGALVPEMFVVALNRLPGADILLMGPRTAQLVIDVQHPDRHHHTRLDRVTLRSVGEALIDEFALSIMKGNQAITARARVIEANEDAEQVVALIDGGWIDPAPDAFHPEPPAPRRVDTRGTVGFRDARATHHCFTSGYRVPPLVPGARGWGALEENRTVHAYVLEHHPDAPWVLNIHGFRQGNPTDFFSFRSAATRDRFGVNVVHPVLPLHGVRRGRDTPQLPGVDFSVNVFGLSQAVWDLRRVISWIRRRSDAPIVAHGVSLGGYLTALLAGLDDRLDAAIVGIPVIDFPGVIRGHARRMSMPDDDLNLLNSPAIDRFHALASPLAVAPKVPADRRYIYAGKLDQISSPEQAMALWQHWGSPSIHWFDGGHVGGAIWDGSVRGYIDGAIAESLRGAGADVAG